MNAHGCSLLLEGAERAASNKLRRSAGEISFSEKARGLQRSRIKSLTGNSVGAGFFISLFSRDADRRDCCPGCRDGAQHAAPLRVCAIRSGEIYFATFLIISMSMVMFTSSPTTTPPPSMLAFHFTA